MRFGGPVVPLVSIRTATPGRGRAGGARPARATTSTGDPSAPSAPRAVGRQLVAGTQREVVGRTEEQRELERRQVGTQPLGAEERVHRDDARAGAQQTRGTRRARRAVAQHEPDRRAGAEARRPQRGVDRVGRGRQVAPRVPTRRSNSTAGAVGSSASTACERAPSRRAHRTLGVGVRSDAGALRPRRRRSGCRGACTSGPAPSRRGTACRATPRSRAPCPASPPSGTTR